MFKVIIGILVFGISAFVNAESYTYVSGLTVNNVYAGYVEGHVFFDVNSDVPNLNNCSAGGQRTIGADPARGNIDHVLSILLYAHAAGKKIDIQVYDQSCISNHIVIRRVKVTNN